jgi:hypothetical protein
MAFDLKKLTSFSIAAIKAFAKEHPNETFYAFAIDASMLCLNSEECAAATLKQHQDDWDRRTRTLRSMDEMTQEDHRDEKFSLNLAEKYDGLDRSNPEACLAVINKNRTRRREEGCDYRTPDGIRRLRDNTGDWEYQGFADLEEEHGFDHDLYSEHYNAAGESSDGHALKTEYAKTMTALVEALIAADAFACLRRTPDFKATWVDHDY